MLLVSLGDLTDRSSAFGIGGTRVLMVLLDSIRRRPSWDAIAALSLAGLIIGSSAFVAVRLGGADALSPKLIVVVPGALFGLFLLLMRPEWLLLGLLALRASIDPLLVSGSGGSVGTGAALNVLIILLGCLDVVRSPARYATPQMLAWLPFLALLALSLVHAPVFFQGLRQFFVILTFFFIMGLGVQASRREGGPRLYLLVILLASVVPTALGLRDLLDGGASYQALIEAQEEYDEDAIEPLSAAAEGLRVMGGLPHPNIYAFFILGVIVAQLYLLYAKDVALTRGWRLVGWAWCLLQLLMLMATQTRSAWVSCAVIFAAMAAFVDRRLRKFLVIAPVLLLLVPSVQRRLLDLGGGQVYAEDGVNSFVWRLQLWESAWPLIKERWAGGWGLDAFVLDSPTFFPLNAARGYDAHNVYVQLAYEAGIPAAVAYALVFVVALWIAVRAFRHDRLVATLLGALALAYLLNSYSDNMHRYLVSNWTTFLLLGLLSGMALGRGSTPPMTTRQGPGPTAAAAPAGPATVEGG